MEYIIDKYVKELIDSFSFERYEFTEQDAEEFIGRIDCSVDFTWDTGATKLAILPKKSDYVIKIPFNGINTWNGYYNDFDTDYCEKEEYLYKRIEFENLRYIKFFVPIWKIGMFEDHPIYLQPKVETFMENNKKYSCTNRSLKEVRSLKINGNLKLKLLPNLWLGKCLDEFRGNLLELNRFLDFLVDTDIGYDLHNLNIGFLNGFPVILDYGGYDEIQYNNSNWM